MPENSTTVSGASRQAQATKASLARQVKDQARQIGELTGLIQEKEDALTEMHLQAQRLDGLVGKLQQTESAMLMAKTQVQSQAQLIESLTHELHDKEQRMKHVTEQALLIDELTARLQEVEIKLAASSLQGKHVYAQNVIKTHMVSGMALGLLPAPLFDIAALSGVQLNLLRNLCKHYGVAFDEQLGKGVVTALMSGSLPVLTVLGLSSVAKLIPGIGTIGGGISMTVLAGSSIYATGQVLVRHFEAGGTLQNFDSKHWRAFFKQQFEAGKVFVKRKLDSSTTLRMSN